MDPYRTNFDKKTLHGTPSRTTSSGVMVEQFQTFKYPFLELSSVHRRQMSSENLFSVWNWRSIPNMLGIGPQFLTERQMTFFKINIFKYTRAQTKY